MNKRILITGANGGIGVELVKYLMGYEHKMLMVDRWDCVNYDFVCQYRGNKERLDEVLRLYGKNTNDTCFQADLTNESDVKLLREKVGPIWGIVNLAGASSNAISWHLSKEEFQRIVSDNLLTAFMCTKEFIPGMREQQGGRIINISSVAAYKGVAGASHYCAAKAGIVGLTRSLALELVNKGITVNSLVLGYFNYGMIYHIPPDIMHKIKESIPAGRFGEIDELGGMIRFLLSDESSYITGQAIHINGGLYS